MALGGGDLTIHGLQEEVLTVALTKKKLLFRVSLGQKTFVLPFKCLTVKDKKRKQWDD